MATETERLLHEAKARLTDLHQELAVAVSKAKSPDDPELVAIDQAIEEQGEKIRRLERMVAAGRVAATAEARRAASARRVEAKEEAIKLAKARIELARKLDVAIAHVGELLAQWEFIGCQCQNSVAEVNRGNLNSGWDHMALITARGNSALFVGALEFALFKAGVGNLGIFTDMVAARKPLGDFITLEYVAKLVAERLPAQLESHLARAEHQEA